jgi:hypothetical protein
MQGLLVPSLKKLAGGPHQLQGVHEIALFKRGLGLHEGVGVEGPSIDIVEFLQALPDQIPLGHAIHIAGSAKDYFEFGL